MESGMYDSSQQERQISVSISKVKRPAEVAVFLRKFDITDRAEVVNGLLSLGLRHYQHLTDGVADLNQVRHTVDRIRRLRAPCVGVSSQFVAYDHSNMDPASVSYGYQQRQRPVAPTANQSSRSYGLVSPPRPLSAGPRPRGASAPYKRPPETTELSKFLEEQRQMLRNDPDKDRTEIIEWRQRYRGGKTLEPVEDRPRQSSPRGQPRKDEQRGRAAAGTGKRQLFTTTTTPNNQRGAAPSSTTPESKARKQHNGSPKQPSPRGPPAAKLTEEKPPEQAQPKQPSLPSPLNVLEVPPELDEAGVSRTSTLTSSSRRTSTSASASATAPPTDEDEPFASRGPVRQRSAIDFIAGFSSDPDSPDVASGGRHNNNADEEVAADQVSLPQALGKEDPERKEADRKRKNAAADDEKPMSVTTEFLEAVKELIARTCGARLNRQQLSDALPQYGEQVTHSAFPKLYVSMLTHYHCTTTSEGL